MEPCSPSKAISTTCSGRTVHDVAVGRAVGEFGEALGLPVEHRVGHALERLAEHDEATGVRVAGAEVDVRQLAGASARTPLDREHHEIERVHRFDLEPARAAPTGLVRRVERLGHDAFMTGGERAVEELLRRGRDRRSPAGRPGTRSGTISARPRPRSLAGHVEQVDAVDGAAGRRRTPTAVARPAAAAMSALRPNRDAVTWNRCGRPSGRSAIASPSATRVVTGSASVASTTSGSRAVTSSRLRV